MWASVKSLGNADIRAFQKLLQIFFLHKLLNLFMGKIREKSFLHSAGSEKEATALAETLPRSISPMFLEGKVLICKGKSNKNYPLSIVVEVLCI